MKTIAPNMAIPIRKPIALATLNTSERKSSGGISGSGARRSWKTKPASRATPRTARPTIGFELQSYWFPPQVVTRMSEATPPVRSAAPSTSIWCRRWRAGRWRRSATITIATAPTGRLT